MNSIFRFLLILLFIQSCTSNSNKTEFIGNWSLIHGANEYEFYEDSIVVRAFGNHYVNSWSIDGSKLHMKVIKQHFADIDNETFSLFYKLSDNGDTLSLRRADETEFNAHFLKINNAYDYLSKRANINIQLPQKTNLIKNTSLLGIDIFIGYRNHKLTATTWDLKTADLSDIKKEVFMEMVSTPNFTETSKGQFNLIIDKNVKQNQIDSIKSILSETGITKMFRVYNNNDIDYTKIEWLSDFEWHGVYED